MSVCKSFRKKEDEGPAQKEIRSALDEKVSFETTAIPIFEINGLHLRRDGLAAIGHILRSSLGYSAFIK